MISEELIQTESVNPNTSNIDLLSTEDILKRINQEDQSVAIAVMKAVPQITPVVDAVVKAFQANKRLFYIGAGTSGRLGVLDAAECPPTFSTRPELVQGIIAGGDTALKNAIEGAEDSAEAGRHAIKNFGLVSGDILIGLSASGSAHYVQSALLAAKEIGCITACITCAKNSPLLSMVDWPIFVETGAEVITGSTRMKAGTAQKLVLNMISTTAMIQWGKTYGNLMVDVKATNKKLRKRAIRLVEMLGNCSETKAISTLEAAQWQVKPAIVMLARGYSFDEAQEKLTSTGGKLKPLL